MNLKENKDNLDDNSDENLEKRNIDKNIDAEESGGTGDTASK